MFGSIIHAMVIDMNEQQLNTVAQLRAFLNGTQEVQFEPSGEDAKRYAFLGCVVKRLRYDRLARADKGVVLRYLERTTGYSRQHLTRLVRRALRGEVLAKRYTAPEAGFARTFTAADVALLAQTDALHGTLSGPATKCLMQRAVTLFKDARYARLAEISVSHLYNLRRARGYETRRRHWTKTHGYHIPIGVRRAPTPEGRPGFIRIDSVHQGDQDGVKGLYHINAVDCVTQFEIVATCGRLSEAFLLPVIEAMLESFPFTILGFHAEREACPWGTTVRSTSTTRWQACWRNYAWSSPSPGLGAAMTTAWPKPRMVPSCANTWATATSRSASPTRLTHFAVRSSTPTSTSTAPVSLLKQSPMDQVKPARNTG